MATTLIISRITRAFLCLVFCLCVTIPPFRADAAAPGGGNTRILSDKMAYDTARNLIVFEGNVHVTRPDMEIWSETLTLVLHASEKKTSSSAGNSFGFEGGGKVEKIIAEKNVRIKQGNKVGTSGKATYFVNDGKIVMEQSPMLVDGDNKIRGRVINYYTVLGRSEVIGDVDVQFTTNENGKGPALPGTPDASGNAGKAASDAGAPLSGRMAR